MKLHNIQSEFKAAVSETATSLKFPAHIIEKDYWVTKLLFNLHNYEQKRHVIFKGGTALSKGHKLIRRFSEDVDLALHPDGIGEKGIHRKEGEALHKVVKAIKDSTFTDEKEGKESEAKRYKRVYKFPQNFNYPESSPIHGKIVLEVNSFSIPTPTESVEIRSLVSEYLEKAYGLQVLEELNLRPFKIEALKPERAFCEKLLALRRASHRGGEFFRDRIRHVYDIHQLFVSGRIQGWLQDAKNLHDMLKKCHKDDELNKKLSETVAPDFKSFEIYNRPKEKIESVKTAYEGLRDITFDKLIPEISDVAKSLLAINDMLKDFKF